ncbi:hypothetical protein C8Q76DRAFT_623107, partial [Earliella scabrosa]
RTLITMIAGMQRHAQLFNRLTAANMSDDETDGPAVKHPPVYRIILAEWQSEELRTFLWTLDRMWREYWERPYSRRRKSGNIPRQRVLRPNSRTEHGIAPRGLWKNCYNPAWLDKLRPYERRQLKIIEREYDFTIPGPSQKRT